MSASTTSSVFPDVNVWLALSFEEHVHHQIASDWFTDVGEQSRFFFCRFTQMGFLRLLSAEAVMRTRVLSQMDAWRLYDRWLADDRVEFLDEPAGVDEHFRRRTRRSHPAPKDWADSYLASFAESAQVTLVTFDRAMKEKVQPILLLSD